MINYSSGFGAFIEFFILNMTGSEYLALLILFIFLAIFATAAFSLPLEITLSVMYAPLLVATSFNSEFLKLILIFVFYFAVLFMKYLTFNK